MTEVGRYFDKTPTITGRKKLSKEALEAIADTSPLQHPWNFFPKGYPSSSPGFGMPTAGKKI